jgi:hypothetical protein
MMKHQEVQGFGVYLTGQESPYFYGAQRFFYQGSLPVVHPYPEQAQRSSHCVNLLL